MSFPRGKKQTPAAVLTAPPKVAATAPSKKRKQPTGEDNATNTPAVVADENDDGVDALFGKKGVAQQLKKSNEASAIAKATKVRKQPKASDVKAQEKHDKDAAVDVATVLTYKALTRNVQLLGCVRQVTDTELLVSLPNKLNGVVAMDQISDEFYAYLTKKQQEHQSKKIATMKKKDADDADPLPQLSQLFAIGQFVPCVVLHKAKENASKKISLSLRLSLLHSELTPHNLTKGMTLFGTVTSMEDHGAVVSVGVRGITAFAPLRELQNAGLSPRKGQQLQFTVTNINAHTSTLTLSPDAVKTVTRGDGFTLDLLSPGMLLNVRVEDVLKNGLRVTFLTFFSATVEQNHMSNPCENGWEASYRKGLKGRARIVSVDKTSKQVTLSMAPHIVHLSLPATTLAIGDVIENASIERVDAAIGMLLSLAKGTKKAPPIKADQDQDMEQVDGSDSDSDNKKVSWQSFQPAYVHISNATDDHLDKLEKKFSVGDRVSCRVIGFAPFDGIVNVSCKASSLGQLVLRHQDLTAGLKVKATILAIEPWGIMLQLSEGVRGVVAAAHVPPFVPLAKKKHIKKDAPTSHKYSVGKTVDARVLRVDHDNKKTYLTMKKALVDADDALLLSDFAKATPGVIAQGFITKIAEYGVVVGFYNNVYGLVPAALLHAAGIAKLEEAYVIGQVVKACVTRCDLAKQRLMLTFDLTGKASATNSSAKSSTNSSTESQELVGQIVTDVNVMKVDSTAFYVQTQDGVDGVLSFVQLSDFPRNTALVDAFVKQYEVGSVITDKLVVLAVDKHGLVLSRKPLLVAHANKLVPRTFADVKERQLVVGYVASVSASRGVFVRFLNQLTALAPKGLLSAKYVSEIVEGTFEMGETVLCSVEKVDKEKQQFVVGFRDYALLAQGVGGGGMREQFVEAQLKEWGSVVDDAHELAKLGSVVDAEFLGVRPYGAIFTMDGETTVIVAGVDDAKWDEGDRVTVALVDYDWEKRVFFGSVDASLVGDRKKKKSKSKKSSSRVAKGTKITGATILAVQSTYVMVAFSENANVSERQLGVLQIADYWCPSRSSASLELEVGGVINGVVHTASLASTSTPFDGVALLVYQDDELLAASAKSKTKSTKKNKDAEPLPKYQSEDLQLGKLVTARIEGIKEHALELKLKTSGKSKVVASVSVVDVDAPSVDGVHPFDQFDVNMVVQGRILSVVEKGANQRKPVSEANPATFYALSVSLRKQDLGTDSAVASLVRVDWQEGSAGRALLQEGKQVDGVVVEQEADGLLVRLSHRVVAFVNATELSTDLAVLQDFRSHFPVGKRVSGWVVHVDEVKKHVDLSLVRASADAKRRPGDVVIGMVTTKVPVLKAPAVMVQLGVHSFGRVDVTELKPPTQWTNAMQSQWKHGQFVQCVVLSSTVGHIDLSLREDALASPKSYVKQTLPTYSVGSLVTAVVASTTTSGCFLHVDRTTQARVLLRDLSDDFIKDPKSEFPVGKLVVGRVTKATDKGLELSLKASVVSDDLAMVKFSDLKVGDTVKGTITKVQTYGVFVKIDKSNISGLCHISEVADERVTQSLDQIFSPGDYVKAKILKIDGLRLSFGLKPSYFEGEPESSDEEEEDDEEAEAMDVEEEEEATSDEEEEPVKSKKQIKTKKVKAEPMEVDAEELVPSDSDSDSDAPTTQSVGFTWDGFANVLDSKKHANNSDTDSDDDDEEMDDKKKAQQLKHKQKKQTDEWIALREKALASQDERPQSADDFERLLAVNPQSSFLWIQYMAFHVSLTQVDLARDVAVRATSAVSFRDEKEKLNVWVALLNLEHDFGDDATFQRVFNNALKVNHPKRVYLQLVDIYARASETSDAETTLQTMQKKFRKSKQTWLRAITYFVAQSSSAKAAETLQKALQALAPHKHLAVILKYGQLMFENGELDKARTIFEGVLANYPKRLDLWNVYLDKEIKFNGGDVAHVRALFERLLAMDFSAKKMKFLFKKFLTFEQNHGDDDSVATVKQLAKDFVAQAASA